MRALDLIKSRIDEDSVKVDMTENIYLARSRHINHLIDAQRPHFAML